MNCLTQYWGGCRVKWNATIIISNNKRYPGYSWISVVSFWVWHLVKIVVHCILLCRLYLQMRIIKCTTLNIPFYGKCLKYTCLFLSYYWHITRNPNLKSCLFFFFIKASIIYELPVSNGCMDVVLFLDSTSETMITTREVGICAIHGLQVQWMPIKSFRTSRSWNIVVSKLPSWT